MGYITYGEEKTQPIQTSTSSGQKLKTGGLSLLGKVGDFLSRGTYASANAVKKIIETKGMANGLDVAREAWHGLKGEDKTTYSDVLDKLGWKAGSGGMANKVARGLVSFTGDVLLDPTTYLTLGTGAGAKIVSKEGTKVLTKQGSKVLAKSAAELGSRKLAEEAFEKVLAESPEKALKYIDKGGVKFMGKTIAGTTPINAVINPMNKGFSKAMSPIDKVVDKIVAKPLSKVIKTVGDIKVVRETVEKLGKTFDQFHPIKDNPLVIRELQAGKDKISGLTNGAETKITQDLKVFTKQEKENVGRALRSGDTSVLTPKEQELNNYLQETFSRYFEEQKSRGITKGEIEGEYLNQMYENPEVLADIKKKYPQEFSKGNVLKEDVFTKKRTINSEEQLKQFNEKYGVELKPIYDVERLLKARVAHSIQSVVDYDTYKRVIELDGVASKIQSPELTKAGKPSKRMIANPDLTGNMRKATSVPGLKNIKGADNIHISSGLADYLGGKAEADLKKANIHPWIRSYDKFTQMFKNHVLTKFPNFHARNFRNNLSQEMLEYGMVNTLNPKFRWYANKVIKGTDLNAKVKFFDKEYTIGELRKIMEENGVLQGKGFFELASATQKKSDLGGRAGRYIENEGRVSSFLMGLEQSGDAVTAAERMKKVLFDYDNLSETEKNVFRRFIPFYTWNSKAVKSVIEQTIKHPGNTAKIFKIMDNVGKNSFMGISAEERASLPEYLQNQFVFKVKGKDGVVRYKSGLGTSMEAIADLFSDPKGNITFALNPAIKLAFGLITGYDVDNGKMIRDVNSKNAQIFKHMPSVVQKAVAYSGTPRTDGSTQYTASPFALYILRQPPFSRYVSTAGVATNDARSTQAKALQIIFGINATESDIERQMKELENKYKDELTAPLRRKGIIVKNEYGVYYIPKSLDLDPFQREAADEVIRMTKDVNYTPVSNVLVPGQTQKVAVSPAKKEKPKVQSKYEAVKTMQEKKVNSKASVRKAMKSIQGRVNF